MPHVLLCGIRGGVRQAVLCVALCQQHQKYAALCGHLATLVLLMREPQVLESNILHLRESDMFKVQRVQ